MNLDPFDDDDELADLLDREEQRGMLLGIGAVILMATIVVGAALLICGCSNSPVSGNTYKLTINVLTP